jgi:hypothetical protein
MKVVKVKDRRSRERITKRLLKERKVVAVVSDIKDIRADFVNKADVIILDESFWKEGYLSPN